MEVYEGSAPAKVLLFGEHAVVYGCTCIAASLSDIRMRVRIEHENDATAPGITFMYHDIYANDKQKLVRQFSWDVVKQFMKEFSDDAHYLPHPTSGLIDRIDALLQQEAPEHAKSLRPSLFLCCGLLRGTQLSSCSTDRIQIESFAGDFPIGAGLGSSAAFSVALSGTLSALRNALVSRTQQDLEKINAYAFAAEVLLHGSPSGVDNTVATFGGTLSFCKVPTPLHKPLPCDLTRFQFLLVNTRVPRSTKVQVANVRARYDANQAETKQQFDQIEHIVHMFMTAVAPREPTTAQPFNEAALGQLIEANHAVLNELGVGHAQIELVASICKHYGGWTKLTGAGGGGCTITLLPSTLGDEQRCKLTTELERHGFQWLVSSIGGAGFCLINND